MISHSRKVGLKNRKLMVFFLDVIDKRLQKAWSFPFPIAVLHSLFLVRYSYPIFAIHFLRPLYNYVNNSNYQG
jgi:hypothetical protein